VEHLDETRALRRKNAKEPEFTGYVSVCQLINRKKCREFRFKSRFVREKMKSGLFLTFAPFTAQQALKAEKETGDERHRTGIMLQPVPPEYMRRTSVAHIHHRLMGFLRRFGMYAPMDTFPEPCEVLYRMKLDPTLEKATFLMEEWKIQDDALGEVLAYKLKLKHPF
jgi:hypothetical protein